MKSGRPIWCNTVQRVERALPFCDVMHCSRLLAIRKDCNFTSTNVLWHLLSLFCGRLGADKLPPLLRLKMHDANEPLSAYELITTAFWLRSVCVYWHVVSYGWEWGMTKMLPIPEQTLPASALPVAPGSLIDRSGQFISHCDSFLYSQGRQGRRSGMQTQCPETRRTMLIVF